MTRHALRIHFTLTQVEQSRGGLVIWRTRGHVTLKGSPQALPVGAGWGLQSPHSDCMTLTAYFPVLPPTHTIRTSRFLPTDISVPSTGWGGCILRGEERDPRAGVSQAQVSQLSRDPQPPPGAPSARCPERRSCADGVGQSVFSGDPPPRSQVWGHPRGPLASSGALGAPQPHPTPPDTSPLVALRCAPQPPPTCRGSCPQHRGRASSCTSVRAVGEP